VRDVSDGRAANSRLVPIRCLNDEKLRAGDSLSSLSAERSEWVKSETDSSLFLRPDR
jgi:hypothetical protein